MDGWVYGGRLSWSAIEAVVFCLKGAGEFVEEDEEESTPQILDLFPQIIRGVPHPKVMYVWMRRLLCAPRLKTAVVRPSPEGGCCVPLA